MCPDCEKLNRDTDMGGHWRRCEKHRYHSGCPDCEELNRYNDISSPMRGCGKH